MHKHTFDRDIAHPEPALLTVGVEQCTGRIKGQPPWAQPGAYLEDIGRAQLQLQRMKLVLDQLKRNADLLVVDMGLQGNLLMSDQAREQTLNAAVMSNCGECWTSWI